MLIMVADTPERFPNPEARRPHMGVSAPVAEAHAPLSPAAREIAASSRRRLASAHPIH